MEMVRIGDGAQIVLVAGRPADLRGRKAAFGAEQAGIRYPRRGDDHLLDLDRVLPVVAEHVIVLERPSELREIGERRHFRRQRVLLRVAVDQPPGFVAVAELVRMAVLPADRDLQHEVQIVKPDRERHLDLPDHRRVDLVDRDPKAGDVAHSAACWNVSRSSRPSSTTLPSLITQVRWRPPCRIVMSAIGSLLSTMTSASLPAAISPTWPSSPTA